METKAHRTAWGPMVQVALEQYQPVDQRLVNDPVAYRFLPTYLKGMVDLLRVDGLRHWLLNLSYESRMVNTCFGNTHVLVLGPQSAPPVVMLQGGNTTSPLTLGWIRPLIEKYRVYTPDTIGHTGKSTQYDSRHVMIVMDSG